MKQYNINFEASKPTQQTFYVPPYSQFQMGVRVDKFGVKQSDISVLKGDTLLSSSGTYNDFYVYDVNSGAPGAVAYTVKMLSSEQPFNILQVVTDSTVYDRNVGGGGGGDFDPTKYYKKTETSSATELNTAFGTVNDGLSAASLSIATLDTSVQANTNDISAISSFTNEVGPILSGDGETTFGIVGQVESLTVDMGMLTGTVNDLQTEMYAVKPAVLADDGMGNYQSKVVIDNNCSADGMGNWTNGITALQQISQAEYDDLVTNMETDQHTMYIIAGSM